LAIVAYSKDAMHCVYFSKFKIINCGSSQANNDNNL